jgi:hypothetical protein
MISFIISLRIGGDSSRFPNFALSDIVIIYIPYDMKIGSPELRFIVNPYITYRGIAGYKQN